MARIIASIVWCFIYAASLLPLRLHYLFSDFLAWLLRDIFAYRKSTIYINLARSFPQLRYGEIKELSKQYYKYMCDIMVESIWQISASDRKLCRMVDMEGGELVDGLMKRFGKVIAMVGHRGNWEMLGTLCRENAVRSPESFSSNEIIITYKVARSKVANLLFEKIRMHEYRKFRNPGRIVSSKQILHHAATAPEKGLYIFIADQYPRQGGIPVMFLNQQTIFFAGAEFIARRLGLPVVYLDIEHRKRGSYLMKFSLICEDSRNTQRGFITREYARLLEEHINANRHNWLWSHKRWKRGFTEKERREYDNFA